MLSNSSPKWLCPFAFLEQFQSPWISWPGGPAHAAELQVWTSWAAGGLLAAAPWVLGPRRGKEFPLSPAPCLAFAYGPLTLS